VLKKLNEIATSLSELLSAPKKKPAPAEDEPAAATPKARRVRKAFNKKLQLEEE